MLFPDWSRTAARCGRRTKIPKKKEALENSIPFAPIGRNLRMTTEEDGDDRHDLHGI